MDKPPADAEEHQRYEYDADTVALEAMDRAGYNPLTGIEFFDTMRKGDSKWEELLMHEMTKTHPMGQSRINELWQTYGRPDHPFFSAQEKPVPLSSESLKEVHRLLRNELRGKLEKVTTLSDWEELMAPFEQDETMTLRDVKLYESKLFMHKEVRAAIAGAIEELETGTGLAEAILHFANYYHQQIEEARNAGGEEPSTDFFRTLFKKPQWHGAAARMTLMEDILKSEDVNDLRKEFDPRQTRKDQEEEYVTFVYSHLTGNKVVEHTSFKTTAELFDPDNPSARMLWDVVFRKNLWDGKKSVRIQQDPQELMVKAKSEAIKELANEFCFGGENRVEYQEEKIDLKEEFLKLLEDARNGSATPPQGVFSGETQGAFLDPRQIEALKKAVAQRVGGYVEKRKQELPSEPGIERTYKPIRTKSFDVRLGQQIDPPRVPEEMLAKGTPIPESYAPFQRVLARYFQRAHAIFQQTLSADTLKREFGETIHDNPEARELLFRGSQYDGFFKDAKQRSRVDALMVERLRAMPELFQYIRYFDATQHQRSVISEFFLRDEDSIRTVEDAGRQLERIRIAKHRPGFMSGWSELPIHLKRVLPKLKEEDTENVWLALKRRLFEKAVRWGITEEVSALASRSELKKGVRDALKGRAQVGKVPEDFLWARLRGESKWSEQIARALGKTPDEDTTAQWRAINRILSKEFMRLMTDDIAEMESCAPDTIQVSRAYFEPTPYAR